MDRDHVLTQQLLGTISAPVVKQSDLAGAGLGCFCAVDVPAGALVATYPGVALPAALVPVLLSASSASANGYLVARRDGIVVDGNVDSPDTLRLMASCVGQHAVVSSLAVGHRVNHSAARANVCVRDVLYEPSASPVVIFGSAPELIPGVALYTTRAVAAG